MKEKVTVVFNVAERAGESWQASCEEPFKGTPVGVGQ